MSLGSFSGSAGPPVRAPSEGKPFKAPSHTHLHHAAQNAFHGGRLSGPDPTSSPTLFFPVCYG